MRGYRPGAAVVVTDVCVPIARLAECVGETKRDIEAHELVAPIVGHAGDGNFHVIPLMNIELESERQKLKPAMVEVNETVLAMGGSLSGEHNDGMIRGPWLERMYGPTVYGYMKEVKNTFDPDNIFNPHKKTDATWDYSFSHIRKNF